MFEEITSYTSRSSSNPDPNYYNNRVILEVGQKGGRRPPTADHVPVEVKEEISRFVLLRIEG
jgi:hypothetical protein